MAVGCTRSDGQASQAGEVDIAMQGAERGLDGSATRIGVGQRNACERQAGVFSDGLGDTRHHQHRGLVERIDVDGDGAGVTGATCATSYINGLKSECLRSNGVGRGGKGHARGQGFADDRVGGTDDGAVAGFKHPTNRDADNVVAGDITGAIWISRGEREGLAGVFIDRNGRVDRDWRIVDGANVDGHGVGAWVGIHAAVFGATVVLHLEGEVAVVAAVAIESWGVDQISGGNICRADKLVQRHRRAIVGKGAVAGQRADLDRIQGIATGQASSDIAGVGQPKFRRGKDVRAVLSDADGVVGPRRRIVDRGDGDVKRGGAGGLQIGTQIVTVVGIDRDADGCGAIEVGAVLKLQAAQKRVDGVQVALRSQRG